jgi:hypothetical protein
MTRARVWAPGQRHTLTARHTSPTTTQLHVCAAGQPSWGAVTGVLCHMSSASQRLPPACRAADERTLVVPARAGRAFAVGSQVQRCAAAGWASWQRQGPVEVAHQHTQGIQPPAACWQVRERRMPRVSCVNTSLAWMHTAHVHRPQPPASRVCVHVDVLRSTRRHTRAQHGALTGGHQPQRPSTQPAAAPPPWRDGQRAG